MAPPGENGMSGQMASAFGGPPLPGDLTETPRKRERSEPPSLHAAAAAARAIFKGPSHPLHDDKPVRTIAAASLMMSADEVYHFTEETAVHKFHYPLPKLVVLGTLAGAYIGFGYSLCCLCAGLLSPELRKKEPGLFNFFFGAYGFPTGLMLCVVAGADLFTSNCMYSTVGVWEGRFGLYGWLRMLVVSYFSNLVGALLLVGLMYGGQVFKGRAEFLIELAEHKVSYGWGVVLIRGILGNWLVCLAVWQGNMGRDFAGRFIGVWLPDAAFVSLGLEHCIANMFLVPMSMVMGSGITAAEFVQRNLIPATLGNLIGGATLVATSYACSLGTPGHWLQDSWEHMLQRITERWCAMGGPGVKPPGGGAAPGALGAGAPPAPGAQVQLGRQGRRPSTVPLKSDMSAASLGSLAPTQRSASPDLPPPAVTMMIPAERGGPLPAIPSPRRRPSAGAGQAGGDQA